MTGIAIGIAEEQRRGVTEILTRTLADEYVLYTKTRKYHWNVVGPNFYSLHELLEKQYKMLSDMSDEVAERIRTLDCNAIGTLAECLEHSRLQEQPGQYPPAREMVADLVNDHETLIRGLRSEIEQCADEYQDIGTADFLTQKMEAHEKMAWMLRAFLQGESV